MTNSKKRPSAIVIFDGYCTLCNGAVQFILAKDKKAYFHFTALSSEVGEELRSEMPEHMRNSDSFFLYENGRFYQKSTAALKVAARLTFPYPLLSVFRIIPPFLRDAVYGWIARNRYRWFGKREACMFPSPEVKERFLGVDPTPREG